MWTVFHNQSLRLPLRRFNLCLNSTELRCQLLTRLHVGQCWLESLPRAWSICVYKSCLSSEGFCGMDGVDVTSDWQLKASTRLCNLCFRKSSARGKEMVPTNIKASGTDGAHRCMEPSAIDFKTNLWLLVQVLAVGSGRIDEKTKEVVKPNLHKGSTVLYSKYSGTEFKSEDDKEFIVVRESDVIATLS